MTKVDTMSHAASTETRNLLARDLSLDTSFGHKAARHKARNVKLAVISCFITVKWKHVASGQHC